MTQPCRPSLLGFTLAAIFLLCSCTRHSSAPPSAVPPATGPLAWIPINTPSPAADITVVGNAFWICGADEMIASSVDGGNTWKVRNQHPGGKTLLHIVFVNQRIGHAAGHGGVFLSTTDGGKTWVPHNVSEQVLQFSFSDAKHGIAALGPEPEISRWDSWRFRPPAEATLKLTHDGGEHWEDIPAFREDEYKPFTRVLSVAALDSYHYLAIINYSTIEDALVVTQDGGKSWKLIHQRNDERNREYAKLVFVHNGEYWAFGQQMLDRQKGGGHLVSMTRHSKDGETWAEGIGSAQELGACNAQGCYIHDGVIESLYGTKEQYWNLPQDGSFSATWAMVGNRVCAISTIVQCAPAVAVEKPQSWPRYPPHSPEQPFQMTKLPFAADCVRCEVKMIRLDPGINWQGPVVVTFRVQQDGSVADLYEDGAPNGPLGALMEEQVERWKFAAPVNAQAGNTNQRHLTLNVKCIDAPDVPTMDGCQLTPAKQPS